MRRYSGLSCHRNTHQKVNIPISIDTCKAAVAKRALDAGASIVNDISGLRADPEMPEGYREAEGACRDNAY